jgi:hypothetical protein
MALILRIALDTPLRVEFDYLPPIDAFGKVPKLGVRVRVPFGRRQVIGVLVSIARESSLAPAKLKTALEILDETPVFDAITFELLRWAADYYHHPLGEVIAAALPLALRGGVASDDTAQLWTLSDLGLRELESPTGRRAPKQRALLAWLKGKWRGGRTCPRHGIQAGPPRCVGKARLATFDACCARTRGVRAASQRRIPDQRASPRRRYDNRLIGPVRGLPAPWRDWQRQDGSVLAGYRRGIGGRRPGAGAGA